MNLEELLKNQDVTEKICTVADLDERLNINLETDKLTYDQIIEDTQKMIGALKLTVARGTIQIQIYERLIRRARERQIKENPGFKEVNDV